MGLKDLGVIAQNNGFNSIEEFIHIYGQEPVTGVASKTPVAYNFDGIASPVFGGTSPGTVASSISAGVVKSQLTKRVWVENVAYWTSEAINAQITMGQAQNIWGSVLEGGGVIPIRAFVYPGDSMGMNIKGRVYPGTGGVLASFGVRTVNVPLDKDFNAPYWMVSMADSNTELTSCQGAVSQWDCYMWQLKKWLAAQGKPIWYIDKSQAARTTTDIDTWRLKGDFDFPKQPSIIVYNLGTNDTVLGTVTANYAAVAAWKQFKYPNSILIFCGVIPRQTSGSEANNATFRTAAQSLVTSLVDPRIQYVELGNLWTASTGLDGTSTQCYTIDGRDGTSSGTYLHANQYGQTLMGNALIAKFQANSNWILNNMTAV